MPTASRIDSVPQRAKPDGFRRTLKTSIVKLIVPVAAITFAGCGAERPPLLIQYSRFERACVLDCERDYTNCINGCQTLQAAMRLRRARNCRERCDEVADACASTCPPKSAPGVAP